MSIGPITANITAGRSGRRLKTGRYPLARRYPRALGWLATHRAASLLVALVASLAVVTPALGAESSGLTAAHTADRASVVSVPRVVTQDEPRDAYEGGFVPATRRTIIPSIELGLTQQRPIPLGVTCSCTIDRTGLTSQFDITVIEVVQDATAMVQQLNRFNRPPRNGARYLAAYVGQLYVAGPDNQAYSTAESDWKATATDQRLSDTAQLFHTEQEFRPRADVFPRNYVNGWLIYELPVNRPAFLIWNYNFVGERGIWFALQ